jgi:hypothetical protein
MAEEPELPGIPEAPESIKWIGYVVAHFTRERAVIKQAPISVLTTAAIIGLLIYFVLQMHFQDQIDSMRAAGEQLRATITYQSEQLNGLRQQIQSTQTSAPTTPASPSSTPDKKTENVIIQDGIQVGAPIGGRRSPTDATRFVFSEINHAQQFNINEPFEYEGRTLKIEHIDTMVGLMSSRPQDGMILENVTAKVLK